MEQQTSPEELALQLYRKIENLYSERIRDYLQKSIRACSQRLSAGAIELSKMPGFASAALLTSFHSRTLQASAEMKQLAEGLDQPFMLFVMGMGKYGKSTLLNALLEQKAADVDIIPKTWKIDIFEGRDDQQAAVGFDDGTKKTMTVAECRAFLGQEEARRKASEDQVRDQLRQQAPQLNTVEEKEELKQLLYDKMLYKSKVVEVRWPVKRNRLLNAFRLVDTPGLVQNLNGEVKYGIQEYYHKADGVIWLLDATAISAQKSRKLLDELDESFRHIGGRADNMIAVLNSIDKVRKQGGDEAVEDVVREARRLFGDLFEDIVPLSAKEAFEGIERQDEQLIARSGIRTLQNIIQSRFYAKAQVIQTESKQLGLKNVCKYYDEELRKYADRLAKDCKEYDQKEKDFDTAYRELVKKVETGNAQFFEKYKNRVYGNIERCAERLFDYSDGASQKAYIQSTIFEFESFGAEVKQLNLKYERMLQDFHKYHASKAVVKEYKHLSLEQVTTAVQTASSLDLETSAFDMDTSGLSFASGAGMLVAGALVLGPIGLVLAGIASAFGLAKWIAVKMKLSGVKSDLRTALNEFAAKTQAQMMQTVNPQLAAIHERIGDIRGRTFASLHAERRYADRVQRTMADLAASLTDPVPKLTVRELLRSGSNP